MIFYIGKSKCECIRWIGFNTNQVEDFLKGRGEVISEWTDRYNKPLRMMYKTDISTNTIRVDAWLIKMPIDIMSMNDLDFKFMLGMVKKEEVSNNELDEDIKVLF